MTIIIADMDGTLATIPDGANRYVRDFRDDEINRPVVDAFVGLCKQTPSARRLIFTGRQNNIYDQFGGLSALEMTKEWLDGVQVDDSEDTLLDFVDGVYIRPAGDSRKDSVVKAEMLETIVGPASDVLAVFDDRPQVVRMWREKGIFVFDCYQGNGEF